jgi:branched-chain amino acid aminotransferase
MSGCHNLPSTDPLYACLPSFPAAKHIHPSERDITVEELVRLNTEGCVLETFGAGTAAVICPIGRVRYRHRDILFPEYPGGYGPVSKALVEALEAIFIGRIKSPWSVRCE